VGWLLLMKRPREAHDWALILGYGYIVGILLTTLGMRLLDALGLTQRFLTIATALVVLGGMGLWVVHKKFQKIYPTVSGQQGGYFFSAEQQRSGFFWTQQNTASAALNQATESHGLPLPKSWEATLWWLLLAWLVLRFTGMGWEILLSPLYPWDAWSTWAVKARVWFEIKQLIPFVDVASWLSDSGRTAYTLEAWHYPDTVPLIQVWMALGAGIWNESLLNIAWLICAVALGFAFYGQARAWGSGPLMSMVFVYLLMSLPLLNVHIVLAGYADLWMAAVYGLATMSFLQWLRTADRRQGLVALLLALALPLIKLEGAVWLLAFTPALLVSRTSLRTLLWLGVGGLTLGVIWYRLGGFTLNLPGLDGVLQVTPEEIYLPHFIRFQLQFNHSGKAFINNLFVMDNWHLLWYLSVSLFVFYGSKILVNKLLLTGSVLVLTDFFILFVLFFLTDASQWAQDSTSINRILLQMVPTLLFYLLILIITPIEKSVMVRR
jgi:hypothetical protein